MSQTGVGVKEFPVTRVAVILVQLFIAVINENFQVAEEIKQGRQFDRFRQKAEPEEARLAWLERINPYKWFRPAPESVNISDLGHNALPIRMAVIQHTGIDASGASDSRRVRFSANCGGSISDQCSSRAQVLGGPAGSLRSCDRYSPSSSATTTPHQTKSLLNNYGDSEIADPLPQRYRMRTRSTCRCHLVMVVRSFY